MATRLTKKQRGFVNDYIKTGNGTKAALNNYDIEGKNPDRIAATVSSENLVKPSIIKALAERLPDDLLEEKHLALLNKKETIIEYNKKGRRKIVQTDEIDTNAVSKGLDMAYKVKGNYAPEKTVNLNLNLEDSLTEEQRKELLELI